MSRRELDDYCDDYLDAVLAHDLDALERLWAIADTQPDLEAAFHALNVELDKAEEHLESERAKSLVTDVVKAHLPSAEMITPKSGPVTLAEAAEKLFRTPPGQLPAEAHAINEALRSQSLAVPGDLNLPKLIAWLEPLFGKAPKSYWKALYEAALELDLARTSQAEYHLAARRTP